MICQNVKLCYAYNKYSSNLYRRAEAKIFDVAHFTERKYKYFHFHVKMCVKIFYIHHIMYGKSVHLELIT